MFNPSQLLGDLVVRFIGDTKRFMSAAAAVESRIESMAKNVSSRVGAIVGNLTGGIASGLVSGVIAGGAIASKLSFGIVKASSSILSGIKSGITSFMNGVVGPSFQYANSQFNKMLSLRYGMMGKAVKWGGVAANWGQMLLGMGMMVPSAVMSIPFALAAEFGKGLTRAFSGAFHSALMQIQTQWRRFWFGFGGGIPMSGLPASSFAWITRIGSTFADTIAQMKVSWASFMYGLGGGMASRMARFGVSTSKFNLSTRAGNVLYGLLPDLSTLLVQGRVAASQFMYGWSGRMASWIQSHPSLSLGSFSWISRVGNAFYNLGMRAKIAGMQFRLGWAQSQQGPTPPGIPPSTSPLGVMGNIGWAMGKATQGLGVLFRGVFSIPGILLRGAANILLGMGASITSLALGLRRFSLVVGIPAGVLNILSLRSFAALDEAVTNTVAVMEGYDVNVRRTMENVALSMSTHGTVPASQLAQGMYGLVTAGLTAAQSMAVLGDIEKFSVVSLMSMEKATVSLTTAQMALGLSSDDVGVHAANMRRVIDVITKAAIISNSTVSGIVEAFTHKSSSALNFVNKTIEEGAAIIAVYSSRGITGALAGERMAMMLRDLQNVSSKNAGIWKSEGIEVYNTAGKMNNIADIIHMLELRMEGLNDAQRANLLLHLKLPSRSLHAVLPLIGYSEELRGVQERLLGSAGTTFNAYTIMMTSFTAQIRILWNNISAMGIEIGRILAPWLQRINELIRQGVTWWRSLSPVVKETMVYFAGLVLIATPLLWLFSGLFSIIMGIITNPITSIISVGAIGTFMGFLANWIGSSGGITRFWENAKSSMSGFFETAIGFFVNFRENFDLLIGWVGRNWGGMLRGMLSATLTFLWEGVKVVFDNLVPILTTVFVFIGNVFSAIFKAIFKAIKDEIAGVGVQVTGMQAQQRLSGGALDLFLQLRNQMGGPYEGLRAGMHVRDTAQGPTPLTLQEEQYRWVDERNRLTNILGDLRVTQAEAARMLGTSTENLTRNNRALLWGALAGMSGPLPPRGLAGQGDSLGIGNIVNQEIALARATGVWNAVGNMFSASARIFADSVERMPNFNLNVPRPSMTREQYMAANVGSLVGQTLGGGLGGAARTLFFRVETMGEQAQRAAGLLGAMSDPLTGMLRAITSNFDLSHAGGRRLAQAYDDIEPVESALGKFKEISLRRFALEGPGGLAEGPGKIHQVRDSHLGRVATSILHTLQHGRDTATPPRLER